MRVTLHFIIKGEWREEVAHHRQSNIILIKSFDWSDHIPHQYEWEISMFLYFLLKMAMVIDDIIEHVMIKWILKLFFSFTLTYIEIITLINLSNLSDVIITQDIFRLPLNILFSLPFFFFLTINFICSSTSLLFLVLPGGNEHYQNHNGPIIINILLMILMDWFDCDLVAPLPTYFLWIMKDCK